MAQRFTAALLRRSSVWGGGVGQVRPGVSLIPERWSAKDVGGMEAATIRATGTPEDLAFLLTWLGDRAEIYNDLGTPVWWGIVYEIQADLGGMTVDLSLENVYNKIAVRHSVRQPDGGSESETTAWAEDSASQTRYGLRELLYSLDESETDSAENVRDRLLDVLADPAPVVRTRGDYTVGATIICRGQWDTLDALYYTNLKGLYEHTDAVGQINLGAAYTASTISFAAADDIFDSANGLGALEEGVVFTVTGSASNNGTFTVQTFDDAGHIETIENEQVDETAGATVTITLGEQGWIAGVGQSFLFPGGSESWRVSKIAFRLQRVGNPVDNIEVSLSYGGYPGEGDVVGFASVVGSSIPDAMGWVEFTLSEYGGNTLDLVAGTTYWVAVGRSGASSLTDYYKVALDEDAGYSNGQGRYLTGGSWTTLSQVFDVPFRVVGVDESTNLIGEALEAATDIEETIIKEASSVDVEIYEDVELSVQNFVHDLLELGTSGNERLLIQFTRDLAAIVDTPVATSAGNPNPVLGIDGKLRHPSGTLWEPGGLVFGRWVNVDALPLLDAVTTKTKGLQALYIERAEYDAGSDTLTLQSEGALDPYEILRWTKG